MRHGSGQRGILGEHLYAHFFEDGQRGLEDVIVMIIDKTDVSKPVEREGFWVYKLNSLVPAWTQSKRFYLVRIFNEL